MKTRRILFIALILFWGVGFEVSAQNITFTESSTVQSVIGGFSGKMNMSTRLSGYRILYFFTTDRREMERVEKEFIKEYDYIPHDWKHDQPYYNLYAGSFVSKAKAMQLLAKLREDFPSSVVVNHPVVVKDVYECRHKLK